jgi:uncharacterized membrane protein
MNIALWIIAGLLAAQFLGVGILKIAKGSTISAGNPRMAWADDYSDRALRGIGTAEVLGALGLILPGVTQIATWLVPAAALGLVLLMIGAIRRHTIRHEPVVMNAMLIVALLVAAVGRIWLAPFGG